MVFAAGWWLQPTAHASLPEHTPFACCSCRRQPPNRPVPAAVFDGHGGFAAAEYLQQNLYKIYTRVLDQKSVQSNLEMSQDLPGEPRWWAPRPSWASASAAEHPLPQQLRNRGC